ncbi:hypothetical protein [Thalassospira xiamenensis]|jgi:hypothetical protein|uniref:hypothetical protein n=1 Tax=Thalassospira xiamenensis TaxID=220697 RepID=UPI00200043AA|nr:hypothetical protein [Thalassospira xiamenensis]MCK2169063.1 hypothetical protein [Thalassospira xiamenensis]
MKRLVVAGLFAGILGSPSAFAGWLVYDVEKWPSGRNGLMIEANPQLPAGLITCRVIAVQREKPLALQSDELTLDPRTDNLVCDYAETTGKKDQTSPALEDDQESGAGAN